MFLGLTVGSILTAQVAEVKGYGLFLCADGEKVLVLAPELAWNPLKVPSHVKGDVLRVKIIGDYVESHHHYLGSIRQATANPYVKYTTSSKTEYEGIFVKRMSNSGCVQLEDDVLGIITDESYTSLCVGQKVIVVILDADASSGRLRLKLVRVAPSC